MKPFDIQFQIYAEGIEEVEELRQTIIGFINEHRAEGRAITAAKVSHAIKNWRNNIFVKNKIIEFFK